MEDLHGVPLDHAALNREVPHRLDVLRPDNRDALVLRRNDRPGEVLDPEPLGPFGHFRSPIQEELSDGLIGGRTLVWPMPRDDGELLHYYTPDRTGVGLQIPLFPVSRRTICVVQAFRADTVHP